MNTETPPKVVLSFTPVKCQFCGEEDFDLPGLKLHIRRGWCDAFNAIPDIPLWTRPFSPD